MLSAHTAPAGPSSWRRSVLLVQRVSAALIHHTKHGPEPPSRFQTHNFALPTCLGLGTLPSLPHFPWNPQVALSLSYSFLRQWSFGEMGDAAGSAPTFLSTAPDFHLPDTGLPARGSGKPCHPRPPALLSHTLQEGSNTLGLSVYVSGSGQRSSYETIQGCKESTEHLYLNENRCPGLRAK